MGKINRVIFFFGAKFNQRDYNRFGFDIIRKKGYGVEAWDFSPWWKPNYAKNYQVPDPIDFPHLRVFNTKDETKSAIATLSDTDIVIDDWGGIYANYDLGKMDSTMVGSRVIGVLPELKNKNQRQISNKINKFISNPRQFIPYIKTKISKRLNANPALDFLITGGSAAKRDYRYLIDHHTNIIKTHALDYDRFLEEEMKESTPSFDQNKPYVAFLDQLGNEADMLHAGIKPYCAAEIYYPEINKFFTEFEEKTGLRIIIAAHPRAHYADRDNPFDGREIIYDGTIPLVKHSQAILAHMSTAVSFAVLYNKPIIFVDSREYAPTLKLWIKARATALGSEIINISDEWSINLNQIKLEKEKYDYYKVMFIKEPGTPEKFVWDIFCDYVNRLNQKSN